jgi:hypothetical protein
MRIQLTCCLLSIFYLLFAVGAFSQKKLNPKISKNETEISSFIMADDYLAFGVHLAYRLSVLKKLKIGAGILYGTNAAETFEGYGAVFADAMQFLGQRQKWSFGGQIGHGIYDQEFSSVSYKLKAGLYYSISCNYRAIVSRKLLFNTSLFIGYRNFHYTETLGLQPENSGLVGLRFGVVF